MAIAPLLARLWTERRASVAPLFMILLPALLGGTGLALEFGNALAVRVQDQRIADAAAFAAAVTYHSTNSDATKYKAAASKVVALNGLSGVTVDTAIVPSPSDSTRNAARVTITQSVPLVLAASFAGKTSQSVVVTAFAELVSTAATCIIAVDGASTGVTVGGGSNIRANTCGVASNATVKVDLCNNYIQAGSVTYNTTLSLPASCGAGLPNLRKPDNTALAAVKQPIVDPYATSSALKAATDRLTTVAGLSSPAAPTVTIGSGGGKVDFDGGSGAVAQATTNGCTATKSGNTWDYNCPPGSNSTIGVITIQGGIKVRFNMTGSATSVLNFNGSLTAGDTITFGRGTFNIKGNYTGGYGGTVFGGIALNVTGFVDLGSSNTATFGSGTYNIARGLYINGSVTATFGNGTFNIGSGVQTCGDGYYSICILSSSPTTFAGPSTFTLAAGILVGGGATATLGSGDGNSYSLGASTNAVRVMGGGKLTTGDATNMANLFQIIGNVSTDGGTCVIFGKAPQHDIKGNLWSAGAIKLGGGVYTVTGSVNFGYNGGGNVTCGGASTGLEAGNSTIVIGATGTLATGGDCAGTAFCVGAGYSSVNISAPGSGDTQGFAVIGPISSSNTAGVRFTSGASGTAINGILYAPNGGVKLDGGAVLGNSVGGCLEVVAKFVSATQGGVIGSKCQSTAGASAFRVRLVG